MKPARLDETIEVVTGCGELRGASLDMLQEARRGEEILVRAELVVACMDRTGRPTRLPSALYARLLHRLQAATRPAHAIFRYKALQQRRYLMDAFAQVASTPLGGSAPPIDMSVYGLFMQADWIVKSVMIALLLASFWSWAIIFEKMLRLRSLKKSAQAFEDTFWSGVSLEDLYDRVGAKPDRSDVEHLLRRDARVAPLGLQGAGRQRHGTRARCASASSR